MSPAVTHPPVSWRRGIQRGFWRAFSGPGTRTTFGALLGVFLLAQLLLLGIVAAQAGLGFLREELDLRIEVRDTARDTDVQDFIQAARALPIVSDVAYITREQTLERQKRQDPTLVDFMNRFGIDNPFPDTVSVRLKRLDDVGSFLSFVQAPAYAAVVNPAFLSETTDQQRQLERISVMVSSVTTFLWFGIVIVGVVILLIVMECLRSRSFLRREELLLERLVGVSTLNISLPFAVEMASLLLIALAGSWICLGLLLACFPFLIPALGAGGPFVSWWSFTIALLRWWTPWIVLSELCAVVALAAGATAWTIAGTEDR